VAGCEFRHRGCGTDQMPDAQKGTNQTMVAFGSVCMIALFVLLSRATVSLSLPLALLPWPADTEVAKNASLRPLRSFATWGNGGPHSA
jgi:hypothetical protein